MTSAELQEILKESHYQTFDFEGEKRDSNSRMKYDLSKLAVMDVSGRSCLDVGCNSGYFLFKLKEKKAGRSTGIDLGEKFIKIAKKLNEVYFKFDGLKFIWGDFFEFYFGIKYDLVLCLSTFHYFGEMQGDFFDKCHLVMGDNGILLIEVEEFPVNDYPRVDTTVRPADRKQYHYPNELMIREFIQDKFRIEDKYVSVKQGGSVYDRYFYKLQKV
jgi:SAM-dependent methyltransferase